MAHWSPGASPSYSPTSPVRMEDEDYNTENFPSVWAIRQWRPQSSVLSIETEPIVLTYRLFGSSDGMASENIIPALRIYRMLYIDSMVKNQREHNLTGHDASDFFIWGVGRSINILHSYLSRFPTDSRSGLSYLGREFNDLSRLYSLQEGLPETAELFRESNAAITLWSDFWETVPDYMAYDGSQCVRELELLNAWCFACLPPNSGFPAAQESIDALVAYFEALVELTEAMLQSVYTCIAYDSRTEHVMDRLHQFQKQTSDHPLGSARLDVSEHVLLKPLLESDNNTTILSLNAYAALRNMAINVIYQWSFGVGFTAPILEGYLRDAMLGMGVWLSMSLHNLNHILNVLILASMSAGVLVKVRPGALTRFAAVSYACIPLTVYYPFAKWRHQLNSLIEEGAVEIRIIKDRNAHMGQLSASDLSNRLGYQIRPGSGLDLEPTIPIVSAIHPNRTLFIDPVVTLGLKSFKERHRNV
ncbi:tegument protein VP13/14 [Testudinid alphaherpesvirus 3]|uniref:Tegument protein VP13/14 n=1 Tax=Testudinid alphaherpesvirus 3 TaxID=2560801 RepID=A0A0K1R1D8_9ALPH|nr:tegument protein VP13/14 [Testudinid alphaherpesvirus 3]AIU39254.1 tegument protein VP13/14 [Testudinid alphaherpesvirus 3]AIU39364.1 tegument protein VP13/14 [Testudinid alphaherpesvirus 3]AKI81640.1 tegument protein VP13/14 [Testudinid alphaherpesvirus 3]AKI81744.1 tegument protein VP13/14 [Testudinid alphaherpesvirus 3]AKV40725.1 UL47 tegument protein VP13/14 [Testudinid alphaherpesvirus 3]